MGITAIPWNITQKKKHGNVTILGNSQPNSQLRGVHSEFRSNMAIEIGKIGTIIPRKSLKIRETCRCLRGSIWCFFPCKYFTLRWSDPRKMLGLVAAFRTAGRQLWQLTVQLLQRTVFLVLDFHLDNDWGNDWVNQFNVAVGFPAFDPGNINKPCTSSNQGIRSDLRGGGDRKGPSMNKSWFVNSLN